VHLDTCPAHLEWDNTLARHIFEAPKQKADVKTAEYMIVSVSEAGSTLKWLSAH
jgi:hypothetical protein